MKSDRVFIEKLSLKGRHGVLPREREAEQEFLVDMSAQCDTRPAARSDELKDAIDYDRFREIARDLVSGSSFYLIETLAEKIAEKILEDRRIASVSITIRKPSVYTDALPGISITRSRA